MKLVLTPLNGIPLIKPGDNLAEVVIDAVISTQITLENDDIFVLAQKIVSKAENRLVNLSTVTPSDRAVTLARTIEKDPRMVELIVQESNEVLRARPGLVIVEHRLGFVCANAGIDHSNVKGDWGEHDDWVLLLPINPDDSARCIRKNIERLTGKKCGVMIIDSHGRAWRNGVVGVCIGLSGVPGIADLRGHKDLFDYQMRVTEVGVADELAAGASLMMGQVDEGTPVIHVRGFPYALREAELGELLRPKDKDMFR